MKAEGRRPILEVIETVTPAELAYIRELQWFLFYFRQETDLLNIEAVRAYCTRIHLRAHRSDPLTAPRGDDLWEMLSWAVREDRCYFPFRHNQSEHGNALPPLEYDEMTQARAAGRLSIEAWTPMAEECYYHRYGHWPGWAYKWRHRPGHKSEACGACSRGGKS
jgi:hypothetical protein